MPAEAINGESEHKNYYTLLSLLKIFGNFIYCYYNKNGNQRQITDIMQFLLLHSITIACLLMF